MAKQGFWSDINTEPKRKFRWVMYIGGIPQWVIKTTDKPSYEVTEVEHQYINHTFWYPGRVRWNEINLTLIDPVTPDASKTLENILYDSGYHFPEDPNDVSTISKANAVGALGNVAIVQLGPEGEEIERWELTNPWIRNTKFGNLDYSADEMVEIELTLRFDYAKMVTPERGGIESARV